MSFSDLVPNREESTEHYFSRVKKEEHEELERQVAEFLSKGNEITEVPPTACKDLGTEGWNNKLRSGYSFLHERDNGQYAVIIDDRHLGIYPKFKAIKIRDQYLKDNNLPAAKF